MNQLALFLSSTRLWIVPAGLVWLFLVVMQNEIGTLQFQPLDASYYSELADDFLAGRPMVLNGLKNASGTEFSPYPPGYPVLLGGMKAIAGTSSWFSFLLLHGILLLLLFLIWQSGASLLPLALVFFSDTALMLGATGISEFSFIIFLLLSCFCLSRLETRFSWYWQLGLIISLCFSVWIRYAGIFLLPFLLFKWWEIRKSSPAKASAIAWPVVYFLAFSILLFLSQWMDTGQLTGGDRYPNQDSSGDLLAALAMETLNQLLIFRNISGGSLASTGLGLILMLFFGFLIIRKPFSSVTAGFQAKDEFHLPLIRVLSQNLWLAALFYLMFLIPLRWFFYFAETFDTRLLGPAGCLLLLAAAVHFEDNICRQPFLVKLLFLLAAMLFFMPLSNWLIN